MIHTFSLPSGLRVVLAPSATDVVYAGIAVATGTRHELDSESGMAHLVEHMTFKGTPDLSSVQILNRMESVGGDLNAYTGKEETIYYATFLRQHLRRALPLLMDIVFASTYPQAELEREREVVIDEIESYNDSPADLIYDDFEALLFPQQPLGRSILGDADRLRAYTSADLQAFASRCYRPDRAVLFVKGKVTEKEVRGLLRGNITPCPPPPPPWGGGKAHPPTLGPEEGIVTLSKSCHQSHVMLGARAYAMTDPRLVGLSLLMNLLGGPAMNARLCQSLRERAGLVYTVEANTTAYTDTGLWTIYFGCDHADVRRCLRLVHRELQRLVDAPLTPRTLAAAQRQLCGQLAIAAEQAENNALARAKFFLHTGTFKTVEERCREIQALTPDALHKIACEVLDPARLCTLIFQ